MIVTAIYGKDRKPFVQPEPPAYFGKHQHRAFERGFSYYVGAHRDGMLATVNAADLARSIYERRGMVQAFLAGWSAAKALDTP